MEEYRTKSHLLNTGKISVNRFWKQIDEALKKHGHPNIGGKKCGNKMAALKRQYKKIKNKKILTGRGTQKWVYYQVKFGIYFLTVFIYFIVYC